MKEAKTPTPYSSTGPLGLSPVAAGTACCVISALGYTGANVCMRQLAGGAELLRQTAGGADLWWAVWCVCNKELVTVAAVGPWLLYRALRRLPTFPSRRALVALVLVGLVVQLVANVGAQWAFGVVGLAIAVPAIIGVMLTAGAVMGLLFLAEPVSRRRAAAIGLLLVSLVLLGRAAWTAGKTVSTGTGPLLIALGVAAACLAGAIYALLTITIRRAATGTTPVSAIVFVTTLMGVLTLGPLSVYLLGIQTLLQTSPGQFGWMYAAGILNLVAFVAISKGLQLTTVVQVNALNASQVAMAALAGVVIFSEPRTVWLLGGVGLTILGVLLIHRPDAVDREVDQHV